MSNFQDNPSVGNPNNKIDGENEAPLKWAYEMDKTQFIKYRCPCAFKLFKTQEDSFRRTAYISYHEINLYPVPVGTA